MSLPRILPKCSPEEFLRRKAGKVFIANDLRKCLSPKHQSSAQSLIQSWSHQGRIRDDGKAKIEGRTWIVWRAIG